MDSLSIRFVISFLARSSKERVQESHRVNCYMLAEAEGIVEVVGAGTDKALRLPPFPVYLLVYLHTQYLGDENLTSGKALIYRGARRAFQLLSRKSASITSPSPSTLPDDDEPDFSVVPSGVGVGVGPPEPGWL
ncbi:unnamed protein product [Cuscuta campestris]|uniref:Uncharacterized protein n=1 Tax=Cuscuta campestris TaxID=132261 RepID=A0A484LC52_9ASTE|nr:unnamed protein product [Cuscuta campestris]